jgi:HAD superfamily hydrolase (TIGR01509 family)
MSLLIFDCDGVLIDSERLYNRSWAEVLPTLGLDWAPADCARNLMGRPLPDCEAIVSAALGRALPDDFLERVFAATDRLFASEGLHPVPGIADALAALPQRKCVASSGLLAHVRGNLARTGLLAHFGEDLFVAAMVPRGKPAPDLFLHAAERMGATPADCVVIEDSLPGVQGARAAGMRVLGYAGGEHDAGALAAAGAELFDSMHHLPGLIARGGG